MRKTLTVGLLAVLIALSGTPWASATKSQDFIDSIELLRHAAKNSSSAATEQNMRQSAAAITHASISLRWLGVDPESAAVAAFRDSLAQRQLDWQSDGVSGISEKRLLDALNESLELTALPTHLQVRTVDFRKARVKLWMNIPELSTGVARAEAKAGTPLFTDRMSPFEAVMLAEWSVYSKLFDPAYVRTDEEEYAAARTPMKTRPHGLIIAPPNPGGEEVRTHLGRVAAAKWPTVQGALEAVSELLEVAGGR